MTDDKLEPYIILIYKFLGRSGSGGYTYEITFNQSLVHTGRYKGIEDGLNKYREEEEKKYEEDILRKAEEINQKRKL